MQAVRRYFLLALILSCSVCMALLYASLYRAKQFCTQADSLELRLGEEKSFRHCREQQQQQQQRAGRQWLLSP